MAAATATTRLRTVDSLRDRNFRWFLASIFAGFTSNDMQSFIRGWLVFELTNSYAALGLMALINGLTGIALALTGGVIADRARQRKRIVQLGQLLSGLNALAIGLLIAADALQLEHILISAAIHGGANNLTMPSRQAMTADVVGPARLMNAMGLYSTSQNAARLLMPGLAGWMVGALGGGGIGGAQYVYYAITACYGVAMLLMWRLRLPDRIVRPASIRDAYRELFDGLRRVAGSRPLLLLLLVNPCMALLGLGYFLLLPGFAKDVLDAGPARLGLLVSVSGLGAVAGSLAVASLPPRRRGVMLIASSLALGISLVAFALSSSYWLSVAIMPIVGAGQAGYLGFMNVLIQVLAGDEHRGRVMSFYMLEFNVMALLMAVMGVAAGVFGPQWTVGAVGAALAAIAAALYLWSPTLRHLD